MKSIKPRKQRKEYFNAPLHRRRKWMSAHLEENLLLKYDRRRVPVVKGDTVRVMRGSYKGHEDKVAYVNVTRRQVEVEGLVMTKADGKKIAKPIHSSNLLITKLNLTDRWRREKLEMDLSEDVKKDIEREAEEQISEAEEEQRKREEIEKEKEEIKTPAEKVEKEIKTEMEIKPKKKEEIESSKKSPEKAIKLEKTKKEKTKEKPVAKNLSKVTKKKKDTIVKKNSKKTPKKTTKKNKEDEK
jgi:large subunit ribosomal protein L24